MFDLLYAGERPVAMECPSPDVKISALEPSEEHYRPLIQGLPAAAYLCDAQGYIRLYNDAAVELWGREPRIGQDRWSGAPHILDADGKAMPLENCPMAIALREGREVRGLEIVIDRPDGTRRNVLPFPRPIRDGCGAVVGAVNLMVDVTDLKDARWALKNAKESAEAANRLKDRFLAVLSHELRTPLTPVLMAVAAIEAVSDLPPALRDEMAMIRRNVELESKLIDDLLDLSRITSGKLALRERRVDLNDAVRHVFGICRDQILEKGVRVHFDLGADVGSVNADPARLQQVLWNVVKNAAKFTPAGGDVYVSSRRASGWVRVCVRDTGIGMSAEVLENIFNAFERGNAETARQFGGLGLGLAISKALVELHGGKICAQSGGAGRGSVFTIELPALEATMENAATGTSARADAGRAPVRLLVVEDHADTATMLAKLLGSAGYSVKTAASAAEALDLASKEPFDLLVSDIGLPDATGYQLMQQIKERYGTNGIAMSGYGMDEDIRKSREAGFSDHLVKPISFAQLDQAIHRLMKCGQ
jgi:PAS domain S-box-containing protein